MDLREVDEASNWAVSAERDIVQRQNAVDNMGSFRLFWDSKVPNDERGWFNWVSFKKSDPQSMKREMEKYKDFYAEMKTAFRHVRNGDEDAEDLLLELYDLLSQMVTEADSKKDSTDSKTLCTLHTDFVEKHQLLENKIRRVEVVVVRQQLRRAKEDWRQAVNELREIKEDMKQAKEDNKDLSTRFERLMEINEQSLSQQQQLRQENELIRTLLEKLVLGNGQ